MFNHDASLVKNLIFQSCDNACYIKSNFKYEPYISLLTKKYGGAAADAITPLLELFHLIQQAVQVNCSIINTVNFSQETYSPGVYLTPTSTVPGKETYDGLAVVNIPKGSFRSIVIDSGGGIASSKHTLELFKDIGGSYLIPFNFDGIYVHPNCFTYFLIENSVDRLMPCEAFDMSNMMGLEDKGLNWSDEAINFANHNWGFSISIPENINFIEEI